MSSCLILMKLILIRNECPLGLFSQKKHQEPQGSRTECSMQTFKLRFNGTNILLVLTLLVLGLQSCISSEWSYEDSLNRVLNPFSFPAASYLGELFCRPWGAFQEHIGGLLAGTTVYVPFPCNVSCRIKSKQYKV